MKKVGLICCLIFAGVIFGYSNVQTDNEDKLIKSVSVLPKGKSDSDDKKVVEEYKTSFQANKVNVTVDAAIIKSDKELPVLNVLPHEFTSEDLKKWNETLFEGKELVEYFGVKEQETAYQYHNVAYLRGETDSDELPDEGEEYHLKYKAGNYDNGEWILKSVQKNTKDGCEHSIYATFYGEYGEATKYNKCSEEYALSLAQQTVEALGLEKDGWQLADCDDEAGNVQACSHLFSYQRYYEGVPAFNNLLIVQEERMIQLAVERLEILVENGKVADVRYINPMDVKEIVTNNADTLSTDEMLQCFQKQMQAQDLKRLYISQAFRNGTTDSEYDAAKMNIKITAIEEGMCCVKEGDAYQMIPVWKFDGSFSVSQSDGSTWGDTMTFMVINALDGSVVDENLMFEDLGI